MISSLLAGCSGPPRIASNSFYLTDGQWQDVSYATPGGSGNDVFVARNPFASFRFYTSATSIVLDGLVTGASTGKAAIYVNGVYDSVATFVVDTHRKFVTCPLPAGTNKLVEVYASASNGGNGLYLRAVHGAVTILNAVQPASRIVVYGDSISQGYNGTINERDGYIPLMRQDYPGRITSDGSGARSLKDDVTASGSAAAVATRLVAALNGTTTNTVLLTIGTNDYGLDKQTSAAFGVQYGALVDAIHAAAPSAIVYAVTPIVRTSEVANGLGETLTQYRTAISALSSGRTWLHIVDGTTILTTGDLSDGLHPTDAGHVKMKAFFKTMLGY
jgi:lysophospholipase L1-like esterase